jgi:hypothetical protein
MSTTTASSWDKNEIFGAKSKIWIVVSADFQTRCSRVKKKKYLLWDAERGCGDVGDVPVEVGVGVSGQRGAGQEGDGEERRHRRHCDLLFFFVSCAQTQAGQSWVSVV